MNSPRPFAARFQHALAWTIGSAALVACAACSSDNDPVQLTPAQAAAEQAKSSGATAANPHAGAMGNAPGAAMPSAGGSLQYSVPEGWVAQTPSSGMRKAQFLLPKVDGDAEDAQLVLFHFQGEGGGKDANFERWSGYFTPSGGGASVPLQRTTRTVNGLEVTEASVTGTLDTGKVQGMGPGKRENWSMLVAFVETPSGPYYARLLGPAPTVSRWEASFRQWIGSLKHAG